MMQLCEQVGKGDFCRPFSINIFCNLHKYVSCIHHKQIIRNGMWKVPIKKLIEKLYFHEKQMLLILYQKLSPVLNTTITMNNMIWF